MKDQIKEHGILFLILCFVALEAVLFSAGTYKSAAAWKEKELEKKELREKFENVPVEARAFSIYDITAGEQIYGKNDEAEMPIASLAKIMTVAVALNESRGKNTVFITKDAIKQNGDYGFFADEKFEITDLAKFVLVSSANDGAYALAENALPVDDFLEKINAKAKKLGLERSRFLNFTGLDLDPENNMAGAYASARDVNIMSMYAYKSHPEIFGASIMPEISIKSEAGFDHEEKNTNDALGRIPNALFSKTGFTDLSGGNLAVIYENESGHEIAVSLLGSSVKGRFSDMINIINLLQ